MELPSDSTFAVALKHQQQAEKEEQQRIKNERKVDFEMQRQLEEKYRQLQHVSDGKDGEKATS